MSAFDEFDVFITITGFKNFPNAKRLFDGDKVTLCPEPENEFDKNAIAVFSEFGKIGYVANSEKTVREGTLSATRIFELIDTNTSARVVEGGYYEAICKVCNVYDIDKMILRACELYNKGAYNTALPLFLEICKKYKSLIVIQYTTDCYIKLERYDEALVFAERSIKIDANDKSSLMMYATILHKLNRYDEAIENYTRILDICENKLVRKALAECENLRKNGK